MSARRSDGSLLNARRLIAASFILSAVAALAAIVAVLMVAGVISPGGPAVSTGLDARLRSYLLDNPEVLIESVRRLEERQQASEANELQATVARRADEIFNSSTSPSAGNAQGDVTVVEFFDYNCPYCRKAAPILADAAKADSGLRIVFKEWPILGPASVEAARVALAARAQDKYEPFHKALMAHSGSVDGAAALEVAESAGLDVARLRRDMDSPEVAAEIERNMDLAQDLRITGTPSFVVGDKIVRGLVDLAALQRFIADSRSTRERDARQ